MSHFHNNMLLGSAGNQGAYEIERSLRFNSADSPYLSRTPSSSGTGEGKTWTWSGWIKRGKSTTTLQMILTASSSRSGFGFGTYSGGGIGSDTFSIYHNASFIQRVETTQVFRDFSSWYHVVVSVDTTQATAADRIRIYVNGAEVTDFSTATYPAQDYQFGICEATAHAIGRDAFASAYYYDGYLAETYLIDGQALDHTSFGKTDTTTGAWIPKEYVGSYGTNGFYLSFSDNSSVSALGTDTSGRGNNWTVSPNFSVTAGVGNDSVTDSPTNNYPTLNPVDKTGGTMAQGNLVYSGVFNDVVARNGHGARSTLKVPSSGKWYVEAANIKLSGLGNSCYLTFTSSEQRIDTTSGFAGTLTPHIGVDASVFNNNIRLQWVGVSGGTAASTILFSTYASGDIVNFAIDFDDGKFWVGKNGTWYNSGDPAAGTNATSTFTAGTIPWGFWAEYVSSSDNSNRSQPRVNFGQQGFEYTAPSGFLAMSTANLSVPTIKDGTDHFNTVLYEGNTTLRSISGVGFQPDFVWLKRRSSAAVHGLWDVVRGASNYLVTNNTDFEQNDTTNGLQDFETDGFEIGPVATWNGNTETYVAWNWKAGGAATTPTQGTIASTASTNTAAGCSIVRWTGTGGTGTGTVGHGLSVSPALVIVKNRTTAGNWGVYHKNLTSTDKFLYLNQTVGEQDYGSTFISPGSTTLTIARDSSLLNTSTDNYIAYCFAEVEGYSKFGGYTGSGRENFIYCGFRPAWIMTKRDGSSNWYIFDPTRKENLVDNPLQANDSGQETSGYNNNMDILSNGFCWKSSDPGGNGAGSTYVFMAFAETPFKYANAR